MGGSIGARSLKGVLILRHSNLVVPDFCEPGPNKIDRGQITELPAPWVSKRAFSEWHVVVDTSRQAHTESGHVPQCVFCISSHLCRFHLHPAVPHC
jgi:hypothetical protein